MSGASVYGKDWDTRLMSKHSRIFVRWDGAMGRNSST